MRTHGTGAVWWIAAGGLARQGELVVQGVILGWVCEADGSRWLTDPEISRGTIDAIESGREGTTVGVVSPWSDRP